eukprot:2976680-Pyramimonas_sp.AAC.1
MRRRCTGDAGDESATSAWITSDFTSSRIGDSSATLAMPRQRRHGQNLAPHRRSGAILRPRLLRPHLG